MTELWLLVLFAAATLAGYRIMGQVPIMLHTPLMSGMNALSGITILGALSATILAVDSGSAALGAVAIILAMVNLAGGFLVTHRMLRMFRSGGPARQRRVRP